MNCPVCDTEDTYEITVMSEAEPRYICHYGHRFVAPRYRPHRYGRPLLYHDPADAPPMTATFDPDPPTTDLAWPVRQIHCGPPAHLPAVPTPDEILRHAEGLGRVMLR